MFELIKEANKAIFQEENFSQLTSYKYNKQIEVDALQFLGQVTTISPLHYAVFCLDEQDNLDLRKEIVKHIAQKMNNKQLNQTFAGNTALHVAAFLGQSQICKLLLQKKVQDLKNDLGYKAFEVTEDKHCRDLLKMKKRLASWQVLKGTVTKSAFKAMERTSSKKFGTVRSLPDKNLQRKSFNPIEKSEASAIPEIIEKQSPKKEIKEFNPVDSATGQDKIEMQKVPVKQKLSNSLKSIVGVYEFDNQVKSTPMQISQKTKFNSLPKLRISNEFNAAAVTGTVIITSILLTK